MKITQSIRNMIDKIPFVAKALTPQSKDREIAFRERSMRFILLLFGLAAIFASPTIIAQATAFLDKLTVGIQILLVIVGGLSIQSKRYTLAGFSIVLYLSLGIVRLASIYGYWSATTALQFLLIFLIGIIIIPRNYYLLYLTYTVIISVIVILISGQIEFDPVLVSVDLMNTPLEGGLVYAQVLLLFALVGNYLLKELFSRNFDLHQTVEILEDKSQELAITNDSLKNQIAERKLAEDELRFQATHDPITKLPNRTLFEDRLLLAIRRSKRSDGGGAVLYLDVDDFKSINDAFGHDQGDNALKIIAKRIKSCIRESDTAARILGDEFIILIDKISDEKDIAKIAKKILKELIEPIEILNSEVFVSGSIGIARFPNDGKDVSSLMNNADSAMYYAKSQGKNTFSLFEPEMTKIILSYVTLGNSLHRALENSEFSLEFQPQFEVKSGELAGAEALLRWHHPNEGDISPEIFIPIAEKNGTILSIGEWVLENAILALQEFNNELTREFRIAVNISERQFRDPNFTKMLKRILNQTNLNPKLIEFEITENALFLDVDNAIKVMNDLKSFGIRLAIDDFGVGYSSWSYLMKFPFDTLKIDKSFTSQISTDARQLGMISGIITISKNLGLEVIAEGIETEAQYDFYKSNDCDIVQGFYLSKPLSKEEFIISISNDQ